MNSETLASLSVAPVAAAASPKKGSPKPSPKQGKKGKGKKGAGGAGQGPAHARDKCVDDKKLRSTFGKLNIMPVPDVIKAELVLKDGRTVSMRSPAMRMNREACVYFMEGPCKTTAAPKEEAKPELQPGLIQTPGLSLDTLTQLAEAEDKEEAAVEAIMRAPMTARDVTFAVMGMKEFNQVMKDEFGIEDDGGSDDGEVPIATGLAAVLEEEESASESDEPPEPIELDDK